MKSFAASALAVCFTLLAGTGSAMAGREVPEQPKPTILTTGSGGGAEFEECFVYNGEYRCPVFNCYINHTDGVSECWIVDWVATRPGEEP